MEKKSELKKLGSSIAKWRHNRGFSQDELAYEAELGRRTIHRIEVGDTDARYSTLLKIAKVLQIRVKELVDF